MILSSAIVPPAEEFRHLTELQVEAALRFNSDPNHPVVAEVARLMKAYGDHLAEHVARRGQVPDDFIMTPRYAVEFIAARLLMQGLNEKFEGTSE
jgi:hypothetical protein